MITRLVIGAVVVGSAAYAYPQITHYIETQQANAAVAAVVAHYQSELISIDSARDAQETKVNRDYDDALAVAKTAHDIAERAETTAYVAAVKKANDDKQAAVAALRVKYPVLAESKT